MAESTGRRPRVLVVDDDPDIRELVLQVLSDEGYEVLAAPNGRVALIFAAEHPPDLILLDYNMPVCDAPEFAAAYHLGPEPHAPIVLITAATDVARRARELQATGALGKPFDLDALLAAVARYAA
jgi:CheY-like chemotaxis protein